MGIFNNDRFTTIAIDTSVFIHNLHDLLVSCGVENEHYEGVVKAQLSWLVSGEWLGELRPKNYQIVFLCDQKEAGDYWRSEYLRRPEVYNRVLVGKGKNKKPRDTPIHYKAGRKLPEYSFTKLKAFVYEIASQQQWRLIRAPLYEADDLAAALVQVNKTLGNPHNILLATVDSDWCGLLDLDAVSWFCLKGWAPRIRYQMPELNSWCQRRLKVTINHPRDIWAVKSVQGDKSDALPPGSPIEVIDLLTPPEDHRLWLKPGVSGVIKHWISTPEVAKMDATKAIRYLRSLGIQPAVRHFDPERDIWAPSLKEVA